MAASNVSSWFNQLRQLNSKLAEVKTAINLFKGNVSKVLKQGVIAGKKSQDRYRAILEIFTGIELSAQQVCNINVALATIKANVDQYDIHQKLAALRTDICSLDALVHCYHNRFVRLNQSHMLGHVTYTEQHKLYEVIGCGFCLGDFSVGSMVRECPECEQFYHDDCVKEMIAKTRPLTCTACECLIHI